MNKVVEVSPSTVAHVGHPEHGAGHAAPASRSGRWGRFLWHLAEMVLAMTAGMALYGGVRALLDPTGGAGVLREHLDVRYLVMTALMAVPMVLWMRHRGHSWGRTAEMVGGMSVPVVAACALWRAGLGALVPALSDGALGTTTHVLMYAGMLLAMLYRFGDYAHAGHQA